MGRVRSQSSVHCAVGSPTLTSLQTEPLPLDFFSRESSPNDIARSPPKDIVIDEEDEDEDKDKDEGLWDQGGSERD